MNLKLIFFISLFAIISTLSSFKAIGNKTNEPIIEEEPIVIIIEHGCDVTIIVIDADGTLFDETYEGVLCFE